MNKITLLEMLTRDAAGYSLIAKESIMRNNHMNDITEINIKEDEINALLVDFINYIGMKQGVDYALYTTDFKKEQLKFKDNKE
jgi:hypothetical protein